MDFDSYQKLLIAIHAIDTEAFSYLVGLKEPERVDIKHIHSTNLCECFVWANTPQGHAYWRAIHLELEYPND